jgi:hypothetical protein
MPGEPPCNYKARFPHGADFINEMGWIDESAMQRDRIADEHNASNFNLKSASPLKSLSY